MARPKRKAKRTRPGRPRRPAAAAVAPDELVGGGGRELHGETWIAAAGFKSPGAGADAPGGGLNITAIELAPGPVPLSNPVRVDPDALTLEADAVAAEADAAARVEAAAAPPAPPTPAEVEAAVTVENAVAGYNIIALGLVSQGAELFAPNWHVTPTEQSDLAGAIVQALLLWFPDGLIPPKYMALLVVAGVAAKITMAHGNTPRYAPPPAPAPRAAPAHTPA